MSLNHTTLVVDRCSSSGRESTEYRNILNAGLDAKLVREFLRINLKLFNVAIITNHTNRTLVYMWAQLIELSKA